MGWYVHISVTFACDRNDALAAKAKEILDSIDLNVDGCEVREARWFLEDLAGRTGNNPGPKGGLSTWGVVGNYTRGEEFCEVLKPLWRALIVDTVDGGPHSFENIIVFEEPEQSEQAIAYEIKNVDDEIAITRHELPFCWGQM